jgi:hypothetical protein
MGEFIYGLLFGITITAVGIISNMVNIEVDTACRNSYSTLKDYEKCVNNTSWNKDVTLILKKKLP